MTLGPALIARPASREAKLFGEDPDEQASHRPARNYSVLLAASYKATYDRTRGSCNRCVDIGHVAS